MKALDVEGVHAFTKYLKDVFYGKHRHANDENRYGASAGDGEPSSGRPKKEMAKGAESSRLWALNKLHEMARWRNVHKNEKWFLSLLHFFFFHAFYALQAKNSTHKDIDPSISSILLEEGVL